MPFLRNYGVELTLIAVLGLAVAFFGYLAVGLLPDRTVDEAFSGARALEFAAGQMDFGTRSTGTQGNTAAGDWLVDQLRQLGWDVYIQEFTVAEGVAGRNLAAVRSPQTPQAPVLILGTHYDTRLVADRDPDPDNHTQPTPGANAGASGPALLLELARTLDVGASGHTVCLAFFDAEENAGVPGWTGQIGSRTFAASLSQDVPRCAAPAAVVAVDMVGSDAGPFAVEASGASGLGSALLQAATAAGYAEHFAAAESPNWQANSHIPFAADGLPAALIAAADYPYRHTLDDKLDKLDPAPFEQVGRSLEWWLETGATWQP
jgi:hypothetical protein